MTRLNKPKQNIGADPKLSALHEYEQSQEDFCAVVCIMAILSNFNSGDVKPEIAESILNKLKALGWRKC